MNIAADAWSLHGTVVLLAEDDDLVARVLSVMLTRLGCEVVRTPDGPSAVEAAKSRSFDVALLDLTMPVFGGIEATRQIRRLPSAPVCIALTGSDRDEDRSACEAAGMEGYLVKPARPDELSREIARHLARSPFEPVPVRIPTYL